MQIILLKPLNLHLSLQNMDIVPATLADTFEIAQLFKAATDNMIAAGIHQWNYTYPLEEHIIQDIERSTCFLIRDSGKILGTISLDDQQDIQYQKIRWAYPGSKALVIHRLAVHPDAQGNGLGKKLCLFAEEHARNFNFESIRLDAYSKNPSSLSLYNILGYKKVNGLCYFHKNAVPFYCFEKSVK